MLGSVLAPTDSEAQRLGALAEYGLLDTPPDEPLDRLTTLAAGLFRVPIVLISLVDADRQFFKSRVGLPVCELDRETSFCTHAILQDDIFVVADATADPQFATNPLVIGAPFVRFYAGKTLISPAGERLGTLCLIDTKPNSHFNEADRRNLRNIAALVMEQMELHRLEHAQTDGRIRFQNIAATSPDAIVCANAASGITFWNRAAERLFGYAPHEFGQRALHTLVAPRDRFALTAELERLASGGAAAQAGRTVEIAALRRDGSDFPAEFSCSTWQDDGTAQVGVIVRDVTEQRRTEERLFRLASRDVLTDLPNRAGWRDAVNRAFASQHRFTVLLLDLGRVQAGQRHARPHGGRPPAARGGLAPAGRPARRRAWWHGSAATSSACCCRATMRARPRPWRRS